MGALLSLLGTALFAIVYGAMFGTRIERVEVLGLSLTASLITLISGASYDTWVLRRDHARADDGVIRALILRNVLMAAFTGVVVGIIATYVAGTYGTSERGLATQFACVAILSGSVAYGELISRYRDTPGRLFAANPTMVYVCVNIAAGTAALALVKEFAVFAPEAGKPDHHLVYEAMLAGFGAIAFFRTSLFTVRVSGSDVGIGPSALLKTLLESSDMMLNRWQALRRGEIVNGIMGKVNFAKAKAALPTMCFTLLTEFPADVQARVGEQINKLDNDKAIPEETKVTILGVYMIQQVGAEVLDRAVKALGPAIE